LNASVFLSSVEPLSAFAGVIENKTSLEIQARRITGQIILLIFGSLAVIAGLFSARFRPIALRPRLSPGLPFRSAISIA
jgi:hypothetical protein